MAELVTVHCHAPSGLILHLDEMRDGELGIKRAHQIATLTLKNGLNDNIDADFMEAWLEANKNSSLFGLVGIER